MIDFFAELTKVSESVPDIPRFYTALAEWLFSTLFVVLNRKRFNVYVTAMVSGGFLAVISCVQYLNEKMPLYLWIPGMLVAIAVMFVYIFLSGKCGAVEAAYNTVQAFILAELAASLEWQLNYFISGKAYDFSGSFWQYLLLGAVFAAVFATAYFLQRRYIRDGAKVQIETHDLLSIIIIAVMVFAISNISFLTKDTPISANYAGGIFYVRTLVDFCGVIMFIVLQEKKLWKAEKENVETMRQILNYQYEQYRSSKESVDIINRKYHDLKHQIVAIREERDPEKREEYLSEMEDEIKMYEAQNKTGNPVLDSILTAKSLVCVKEDINLTTVADGSKIGFMSVMDICSIVGNALDNAIEYEKKLFNKDERLIKVAIYNQGNILIMRFENYVKGKIEIRNGLVVTTKVDKNNHGFGMKSMKFVAEKYGGVMKAEQSGEWFSLNFVIPVKP